MSTYKTLCCAYQKSDQQWVNCRCLGQCSNNHLTHTAEEKQVNSRGLGGEKGGRGGTRGQEIQKYGKGGGRESVRESQFGKVSNGAAGGGKYPKKQSDGNERQEEEGEGKNGNLL